MDKRIVLGSRAAADGGYRTNLPLDRDVEEPIVVDATGLAECNPMFAVRLRLFVDWHLAAKHAVIVEGPHDVAVARQLADFGVALGLCSDVFSLPAPSATRDQQVLPVGRLENYAGVEELANEAIVLLHRQAPSLACWGNAMHMAIGELCDNSLLHGRNELGVYVAADRIVEPRRQLRLAIADLGIGIPEHIRSRYPEWHDDSAAIARALERGVSGTGDPHRGNGFSEVFREAVETDLVRARSAADIDIRSGRGRVGVRIVGGTKVADGGSVGAPRRGTWITYTITTA
jgi:hypothetical protein